MDFAFSQKEQSFFENLELLIKDYSEKKDLEKGSTAQLKRNLMGFIKKLLDTPYLKISLDNVDEIKGDVVLMKAMEIISGYSPSILLSLEMSSRVFGKIISTYGTPEQKNRWLPKLIQGKMIGAVALSENAMNIDNDPFEASGVKKDNTIEINGKKQYVVNAPIADWIAVAGIFEGRNAIFIIEQNSDGLSIGERMPTLGYDGAAISDVSISKCYIPMDQMIGPLDENDARVRVRQWENQILIGTSLGLMQSSVDVANAYSREHKTGGKPIIAYQEVSFQLAEMLTLLQAAQLLAYRAAWYVNKGDKDTESLIYCAKVFCAEAAERVASQALQILSGKGYVAGNVAERSYRYAKYNQIAGTSTELSRVKIGDSAL